MVCRLVRKGSGPVAVDGLRVTVVLIILMIQLLPGQFALICSGASYRFSSRSIRLRGSLRLLPASPDLVFARRERAHGPGRAHLSATTAQEAQMTFLEIEGLKPTNNVPRDL